MQVGSTEELRELAKQARVQKSLKQSDVASLLGYSTKWVSDFETGKVSPPVDMVLNLLNVLGVKLHVTSAVDFVPADRSADEEIDIDVGIEPKW